MTAGYEIVSVDGQPVLDLSLDELIARLRGAPGTQVAIGLQRGNEAVIERVLTRRTLATFSIIRVDGEIAVVTLPGIRPALVEEVQNQLAAILLGDQPPAVLVLDLRQNSGGQLASAVEIADLFLSRGLIITVVGQQRADIERYSARRQEIAQRVPLYVLIDEGTQSGAAAIAAALADHRRARIVGESTPAHGDVQTVLPISANRAIRFTTGRMLRPNGNRLDLGIRPDIAIERAESPQDGESDSFLERAMRHIRAELAREAVHQMN